MKAWCDDLKSYTPIVNESWQNDSQISNNDITMKTIVA